MSSASSNPNRKSGLHFQAADLLCQNGCGYYGNPAWHGYCSVCYREVYIHTIHNDQSNNSVPGSRSDPSTDQRSTELDSGSQFRMASSSIGGGGRAVLEGLTQSGAQSFTKFEEKRKQIAGKGANTMKNIFRISKDVDRSLKPKPVSTLDENQTGVDFFEYLKKLRKAAALDVSKQVKRIIEILETKSSTDLEEYSLVVHNFYQEMFTRINTHSVYKGMTEENRDHLMDRIERYLTTRLYQAVFSSPYTDDEERDLALQNKMRSLHWITPAMLEAQIDEEDPKEKTAIYEGITALIEMNNQLAPQDKLTCVVRCCRAVLTVLRSRGRPANADEFLPALIWLLLRANPPLVQSNIQFVTRFANPTRLNTGEAGYYFTNLCCALHFIENLTHESLSMTEEEFGRCMRGEAGSRRTGDQTFICEGLRIMADNDTKLNQLFVKYEALAADLDRLESESSTFQADLVEQVKVSQSSNLPDLSNHISPEAQALSIRQLLLQATNATPTTVMDTSIEENTAVVLPPPILPSSRD